MEEKRREIGSLTPPIQVAGATTSATSRSSEMAVTAEPASRRRGGNQKRKSNGSNTSNFSSTPSKRLAREKISVPIHQIHNGPCTRARQFPSNLASNGPSSASMAAYGAAMQNQHEAGMQKKSVTNEVLRSKEESNAVNDDWQALESAIEAEFKALRGRDSNAHVVPIPSGWFSWTKVHPVEERTLLSFFNGKSESRTPEMYMEIRNWIMKKYHTDPTTNIDLKDLTELSVGELDARQEVMEFLDHWGLINFHPFPESCDANADDLAEKTDSLIEKLYHFETLQSSPPAGTRTNISSAAPVIPSGLFSDSASVEESIRPEGPSVGVDYHCNSCSADCSRKRYHCQKQADFDLCTECFSNGKFGSDMSTSDFILMEPAEVPGVSGGNWTDQETLLLLEALELFTENWNEIAEHVATKTKNQCILHFLQMPIEDTFLDCDDDAQENKDCENKDKEETKNKEEDNNGDLGSNEADKSVHAEAPETLDNAAGAADAQNLLSPAETSKHEGSFEEQVGQESGENFAEKALKEAFEAVGYPLMPDSLVSFTEVGNPVMALAAFLVRLVESDVVTATARSSFKSLSGNSPSLDLALKHCFILEDPPGDEKKPATSEGVVAEMVQKNEKQTEEDQKKENSISVLDGSDQPNDLNQKNNKDSSLDESAEKSIATKEDHIATNKEVKPVTSSEENNTELLKENSLGVSAKSDDIVDKLELTSSSNKDAVEGVSVDECIKCTSTEPKDVDMVTEPRPLEMDEPQSLITSDSSVENGANTGEDQKKDSNNEKLDSRDTKDDHNSQKLKRAAVTALSAAAVKAKLLVKQEEEQIRQLATLVIGKQLHKLETKLAFFAEMESVVMRVKEQIDRSRQRLYQERAHIITSRLGSSRPMLSQSIPTNRMPNSAVTPINILSQRPPVLGPMMASALPISAPSISNIAAGASVRPSSPSVGMK